MRKEKWARKDEINMRLEKMSKENKKGQNSANVEGRTIDNGMGWLRKKYCEKSQNQTKTLKPHLHWKGDANTLSKMKENWRNLLKYSVTRTSCQAERPPWGAELFLISICGSRNFTRVAQLEFLFTGNVFWDGYLYLWSVICGYLELKPSFKLVWL